MQVSEQVAGRELDALVAEEVMGWSDWNGGDHTGLIGGSWFPSTNIYAAWQVVERVAGHVPNEFMLWQEHGQWAAEFQSGTTAFAKTAPLAICLAALKAVEA